MRSEEWVRRRVQCDRSGKQLPALTRNTRLFNFSSDKFYTDNELDFSQGWPTLPQYSDGFEAAIPYSGKFTAAERQALRGKKENTQNAKRNNIKKEDTR